MMIRLLAWPWSCQWRRASLAAVSMASEPPLTQNTLASSMAPYRGDAIGEQQRLVVGDAPERVVGLQPPHLGGGGVGQARATVADVGVPQAGGGVQQPAAVVGLDVGALAGDDRQPVARDARHVGLGRPERGAELRCGGHRPGTLPDARVPRRGKSASGLRQLVQHQLDRLLRAVAQHHGGHGAADPLVDHQALQVRGVGRPARRRARPAGRRAPVRQRRPGRPRSPA